MKSYHVEKYIEAGCKELEKPAMYAVWGLTGGKVCDTGCHAFNGGKNHKGSGKQSKQNHLGHYWQRQTPG